MFLMSFNLTDAKMYLVGTSRMLKGILTANPMGLPSTSNMCAAQDVAFLC